MGSNHAQYVELRTRYLSGWTPPVTEFPNEVFVKPNVATMWARFNILEGIEMQMDIGDEIKTFRSNGLLVIQVFAPLGKGSIDILNTVDTLAAVFRNWCGTTVTCREASVKKIGNDVSGWYQINVEVPFKQDTQY